MRWELFVFASASMLVFLGCMLPARWMPPLPNDKLLHFLSFAFLSFIATFLANSKQELFFWFFGLLLAGLVIEGLQILVPGRRFCHKDLTANAIGILTVAAYAFLLQ